MTTTKTGSSHVVIEDLKREFKVKDHCLGQFKTNFNRTLALLLNLTSKIQASNGLAKIQVSQGIKLL
jgi:hypothetical protein